MLFKMHRSIGAAFMQEDDFFDEITPFEQGSDARFQDKPFDSSRSSDWQTGWRDTDRDLCALEALHRGQPCPVCAAGEHCVICAEGAGYGTAALPS